MFPTKQWLTAQLSELKVWIRNCVADALDANSRSTAKADNHEARPGQGVDFTKAEDLTGTAILARAAATVGVSTEKKGEAKPPCSCQGCINWRTDPVRLVCERIGGVFFGSTREKEEDGVTPWCWGARIRKLEDQIEALLRHQGLKISYEPEQTIEGHYVVESLTPAAEPTTPAKAKRTRSRTKAR